MNQAANESRTSNSNLCPTYSCGCVLCSFIRSSAELKESLVRYPEKDARLRHDCTAWGGLPHPMATQDRISHSYGSNLGWGTYDLDPIELGHRIPAEVH